MERPQDFQKQICFFLLVLENASYRLFSETTSDGDLKLLQMCKVHLESSLIYLQRARSPLLIVIAPEIFGNSIKTLTTF